MPVSWRGDRDLGSPKYRLDRWVPSGIAGKVQVEPQAGGPGNAHREGLKPRAAGARVPASPSQKSLRSFLSEPETQARRQVLPLGRGRRGPDRSRQEERPSLVHLQPGRHQPPPAEPAAPSHVHEDHEAPAQAPDQQHGHMDAVDQQLVEEAEVHAPAAQQQQQRRQLELEAQQDADAQVLQAEEGGQRAPQRGREEAAAEVKRPDCIQRLRSVPALLLSCWCDSGQILQ